MSPRSTRLQLWHAKLDGASYGLRGAIWMGAPVVAARHRAEWPELWERLDRLVEVLDGAPAGRSVHGITVDGGAGIDGGPTSGGSVPG